MLETIEKILRYTGSYKSAEELYENDRDFDATMMNFMVIGEEVGKLTDGYVRRRRMAMRSTLKRPKASLIISFSIFVNQKSE